MADPTITEPRAVTPDPAEPLKDYLVPADPKAKSREDKKALADEWHEPIEDFPVDGVVVEAEVADEILLCKHINGTWQLAEPTHPITVVRPTRWRGYRKDRTASDYPKDRKPPPGSSAAEQAEPKPV